MPEARSTGDLVSPSAWSAAPISSIKRRPADYPIFGSLATISAFGTMSVLPPVATEKADMRDVG